MLGVRDAGGGGVHGAGAVPGPHPADAGVRLQQIPAQEPADPVRRDRHLGGLGRTPPQQAGVYQPVDAAPDY